MKRRPWFAVAAAIVALVAVLATLTPAPAPAQARTFVWEVQSAFPVTDYPHRSLVELARSIELMSAGRLKVEALPVGSVVGGPFGMGQNEFTAWLFSGGGQELYNELLQKELKMDVVSFFTTAG
jgi:TRAP-type mannitol/chloroaromatic compound transport system substrate-binding protein